MWRDSEHVLVRSGELMATLFRFSSGVLAVRLTNRLGSIVMLPYQGQQIWSATIDGRSLGMQSMFDEPQPTTAYLHTYGGFFVHCGATRMGVPGPTDTHPLHGELPNAPYQQAWLTVGTDARGEYLALSGTYRYTVAFQDNYVATPEVRFYAGLRVWSVTMTISNHKKTAMDLMYLAHINYRPVDHAVLLTTAPTTAQAIRVRQSIPSHISPAPGYREFIAALAENPGLATTLEPGLGFDPEVVFTIDAAADEDGWAHSIQRLPDGTADYVAHRPDQLPFVIRWISRTPDQDCLGFAMPATAEPEGYTAEKSKGHLQSIAGLARWECAFVVGVLDAQKVNDIVAVLDKIR